MIKDYYLNQQDQLLPYLDTLSHLRIVLKLLLKQQIVMFLSLLKIKTVISIYK